MLYFLCMKRLIIVGGKAPDKLDIDMNSYSEVIAADSGYDTARKLGIEIDSAVGDFDSTDLRGELIGKGFVPCSHDKDCSDTELAVRSGSGDYDLIGGGEGRIDHTLELLSMMQRLGSPAVWYMASDTVFRIDRATEISAPAGTDISFFALSGTVHAHTEGLVWELDGFPLSSTAVSLSNRTDTGHVFIDADGVVMARVSPDVFRELQIRPVAR